MIKIQLTNVVHHDRRFALKDLEKLDPLKDHAIVLVPEQYTLDAEKALMKGLDCQGLFHIEVLSFKRLVHRLTQSLNLFSSDPLSELGKKLLIKRVLLDLEDHLVIYKKTAHVKGFLDDLYQTLTDMRQNAVQPIFLRALVGDVASQSPLFSKKLGELTLIYETYLKALGPKVFDEDLMIESLVDHMESLDFLSQSQVVVEGFSSMTIQEVNLLVALGQSVQNLTVCLTGQAQDRVVNRYPQRLKQSLVKAFTDQGLTVEIDNILEEVPTHAQAFASVFDQDKPVAHASQCCIAPNKKVELEAIFIDAINRYQHEGYSWKDMAILTNDMATYTTLAKRLSDQYKLPLFIDQLRPALSHYAIDFILTSLKVVMSGFKGNEVIKVTKSGFFDMDFDDLCQFENWVYEKGIRGTRFTHAIEDPLLSKLEESRQRITGPLYQLKADLNQAEHAMDMIKALKAYLDHLEVFSKLSHHIDAFKALKDYDRAEEYAQIHNIIDDVLYQIHLLGQGTSLSLAAFYDMLKVGFQSYEIGVIPQHKDYMTLGNIKRSRLGQVKWVYFVGMNDGVLPAKVDGVGLFSDEELNWLMNHGITKMRSTLYQYDEEVYKTYENTLNATQGVMWSRVTHSLDGVESRPSIWFDQLVATSKPHVLDVGLNDLMTLGLGEPFVEHAMEAVRQGQALSDKALANLKGVAVFGDLHSQVDAFIKGLNYTFAACPIPSDLSQKLYGDYVKSSVTRLESFSKCPYQHFARYALKPKDRQSPDLSGLDIGDLFHDVIEGVMNDMKTYDTHDIQAPIWEPVFENHYQRCLSERDRFSYNAKNKYYAKRLKGVIKEGIGFALDQIKCGDFKNVYNELTFGIGQDKHAPPLVLETPQGQRIVLEGKIDRVDVLSENGNHYIRVIDYKSGYQNLDLADVYEGLNLQLVLYLDVATTHSHHLLGRDYHPFGAFYYKLSEPLLERADRAISEDLSQEILETYKLEGICLEDVTLIKGNDRDFEDNKKSKVISARLKANGDFYAADHLLEAQDLSMVMTYTKHKAQEIALAIFAGHNDILPVKDKQTTTCDWCNYATICQFDEKKTGGVYKRKRAKDKETILDAMTKEVDPCGH